MNNPSTSSGQKRIRIAINGFGRVGRPAFKIALEKDDLEVVAINDLADNETLAHLLKYDSVYGRYDKKVSATETEIVVDGKSFPVYEEKDPDKLPWKKHEVDVVLECTGKFVKDNLANKHIDAGAKRVILSAPAKGEGGADMLLLGVNHENYKDQTIVSNASCTTNCIAPPVKVLLKEFGIKKGMMTTIHSYTADQRLIDSPHKDLRRARAAALNIIPTTTGAARATGKTIPEVKGIFDGMAVRVPTVVGSLSDITLLVEKKTTIEEVNKALTDAANSPTFKGIMEVTNDPIVSSDIIGNTHSSIVDLSLTNVLDGDMVKIIAWYDNEIGYSNRLVEMAQLVGKSL
ncbi:type I glyceraldehyde-3-phosphate dehydrogenase [Patescibacteria group bacterium]